jgi:hypothetical protein
MKKEFGYVQDREGNAVAGAEVYIRVQGSNALATLYSDDGVTPTSNPLTTDNDGEWSAYWADGVYKIQVYVEGVQQQEVNNYQHFDIDGATSFGISLISAASASAAKALLDLEPGTDVQAYDAELAQIAGLADPNADRILFWDDSAGSYAFLAPSTGISISTTNLAVDGATAAQYRGNTADKVLVTDDVWSAAASVALTPGTNVSLDLSTGFNFTLAMGGNYTLDNFTNGKAGQTGCIEITQDGTGSRTLAFGTAYLFADGVDPVLSTTAGAKDLLFYQVLSGGTTAYATLVSAIA